MNEVDIRIEGYKAWDELEISNDFMFGKIMPGKTENGGMNI